MNAPIYTKKRAFARPFALFAEPEGKVTRSVANPERRRPLDASKGSATAGSGPLDNLWGPQQPQARILQAV